MKHRFGRRRSQALLTAAATVIATGALGAYALVNDDDMFDRPRESLPITIAATTNESAALVWIAEDQGFFEQVGLNVTLNAYGSGRLAGEAMLAGEADVATAAEFVAVRQSFEHDSLRVIGSIAESRTIYLVARRDHGIEVAADLTGARIGVPLGTQAEFFLDRLLAFNGVGSEEVQLIDLAPSEMVEQLVDGDVDGIAVWDPIAYGGRVGLADNAVVFPGSSDDVYHFLVMATEEWVADQPDVIDRFIRGLALAKEFNENRSEQARAVFETRFGRDPEYLAYAWQTQRFALTLPQRLISILERQAGWAIDRRLVRQDRQPDYMQILEPNPLSAIDPTAVTLIH